MQALWHPTLVHPNDEDQSLGIPKPQKVQEAGPSTSLRFAQDDSGEGGAPRVSGIPPFAKSAKDGAPRLNCFPGPNIGSWDTGLQRLQR